VAAGDPRDWRGDRRHCRADGGGLLPARARNRLSLFLPPAALLPTAIGAMLFKLSDRLYQSGHAETLVQRPSETIESYLYYFILAYLIVFARRLNELEAAEGRSRRS
jgi:hypothetical protein